MKLTKFDIGAEVISILTRGMYPDPRDAVREYIQNAIDAKATNVDVKVRNKTIVIQDNGIGMNYDTLRKSVRVGVSDKNPSKDVGFMGIGIYSAYHLCDKLDIYSRGSDDIPNKLTMNFEGMKDVLEIQKEERLEGLIDSSKQLDLQTILEKNIDITQNGELKSEEFPSKGTRVVLSGLSSIFYNELANFEELSDYIKKVIPLHFDKTNFTWGSAIEQNIKEICQERNVRFELVNLTLQVNAKTEVLYRPYQDKDFNSKGVIPKKTEFYEIRNNDTFFGVVWACLNDMRRVVSTADLRGFILKKQGFSIGRRKDLIKHFPHNHTYFNRYIGEVIITNSNLLPNASRNDLEFSELRTQFFKAFTEVTAKLDEVANNYQEWTKADEWLTKYAKKLEILNGKVNLLKDPEKLIDLISDVKQITKDLTNRIKRKAYSPNEDGNKKYFGTKQNMEKILQEAKALEKTIQDNIEDTLQNRQQTRKNRQKNIKIAKNINKLNPPKLPEQNNYENIFEMLKDLDVEICKGIEVVLQTLDESFIQEKARNKPEYYQLLEELKNDIQENQE